MLVNLEALKKDVKVLFEAIEAGVYGTRSIVGDVSLLMDGHIRQLEKEVGHLTPNPVDAKKPCIFNHPVLADRGDNFCSNCGEKFRATD